MDTLQQARDSLRTAEDYMSNDRDSHIAHLYANAQAYASIAIAEQLTRIADALHSRSAETTITDYLEYWVTQQQETR